MHSGLAYLGATEIAALFRDRELSPVEYLESLIHRIEAVDPIVNSLVELYFDEAKVQARLAERVFADRDSTPGALTGIPVGIKEETAMRGKVTTNGSLLLQHDISDGDAPVVERLRAAGAIIHARTAAPEFCCGPFTHSRLHGITRNPWDLTCAPGGSSGGAGDALAAGLTPLADGSDIGGSIRMPAGLCGVVGYKPPFGRVPSSMPYALDSYNHQGPLARNVADCALMQDVLSGYHPSDPATVRESVRVGNDGADGLKGVRVAVSTNLGGYNVDPEVAANVAAVAEALRSAGAIVEQVELNWDPIEIRVALFAHFGAIFGPDVRGTVAGNTGQLNDYTIQFLQDSEHLESTALFEALTLEARLYRDLERVFASFDVLICPTNSVVSLEAGEAYLERKPWVNGTELASVYDAPMTTAFNLTSRCPVLSVPSGISQDGLPLSLQIVAAPFDDASVFQVGLAMEAILALDLVPQQSALTAA